jgi:TPR repeat protein
MRALRSVLALVLALTLSACSSDVQVGVEAYERGDYAAALEELRPLAERGDAGAQFSLGGIYYYGAGVPQDSAEAVKWYHLAAEQGDADAQSQLGKLYENGAGVPQDYVLAHMWFNLAATHLPADLTQDLGALNRDFVEKSMTPDQVAEAHRLAREWKPK